MAARGRAMLAPTISFLLAALPFTLHYRLRQWRGWGFTDELINEAAGLAIGKSGPIVYINSILSSWKNKNAFTLDEVRRLNTQVQTSQKQSTVHFANERKYTREELDALITDVDDIDI